MEDLSGRQLGRYIAIERIGQGGMAEVYRGIQPSANREVAIKVLPREFTGDSTFAERFRREGRIIASLEHPAIVPVHDVGEDDGIPFIVMRLVPTGSLAERLQAGGLPPAEAVRLGRQIANALDYAHERNVVHRDIKPSNILLDPRGNAMVADFGVAKILESTQTLTKTDWAVGTPAYMAPEQAQGQPVGPRSDLYSFGIVLFAMLTGQAAYAGATPVEILFHHVHDPIPSARERNPALPQSVDGFFAKALAKNRQDRFGSAREMMTALSAALTEGTQPTLAERAGESAAESEMRTAPLGKTQTPRLMRAAGPGQVEQPAWPYLPEATRRGGKRRVVLGAGALLVMLAIALIAVRDGLRSPLASHSVPGANLPVTGGGLATVSDVVGTLQTRLGSGGATLLHESQTIPFESGRKVWTGSEVDGHARLVLPGNVLLFIFMANDTEVELAEQTASSLFLVLHRNRILVQLPPDFPPDIRLVVATPSGATARVSGSLMGVSNDPTNTTLTVDCLEGVCWAGSMEDEARLASGERGVVNAALQVGVETAQTELWLFAPGVVPTPTVVPYGAASTWPDRFVQSELERERESAPVVRSVSGLLALLVLGTGLASLKARRSPGKPE